MKIVTAKLDSFLQSIKTSGVKSCLLFGPNYGLKYIIGNQISSAIAGKKPNLHEGSEVESDPSYFYNELFNHDLFGDNKVLLVSQASNKFTSIVENILKAENPPETFFIIVAGDLDTKSTLRALYEKSESLACIACYAADKQSNMIMVKDYFKTKNLSAPNEVIEFIAGDFKLDSLILQSELDKLVLYLGQRTSVNLDDVKKVMHEESSSAIEQVIESFISGDLKNAFRIIDDISIEDKNPVTFARMLLLQLMQIRRMLINIDLGSNSDIEMQKERIFFKRMPIVEKQLRTLKVQKIDSILHKLLLFEIEAKSGNSYKQDNIIDSFMITA